MGRRDADFDFCGPHPADRWGNKYLLVGVDEFTKWVGDYPTEGKSDAPAGLKKWVNRHGLMKAIRADSAL